MYFCLGTKCCIVLSLTFIAYGTQTRRTQTLSGDSIDELDSREKVETSEEYVSQYPTKYCNVSTNFSIFERIRDSSNSEFIGKSIPSMRFKRLYSISLQIPVEVLLTFRLTVLGSETNFTKIDLLNRLANGENEISTRHTKTLLFQYNFSNVENVEIMKTSLTYVYTLSNTSYTFEADFPITKSLNSSRVLPTILPHLRRLFNQVYGVNDWQQKPETSTSCTAIWFEKCAQMVAGHDQDISTVFCTTAILQEIAITVNVLHNSDSVKYLEDIHTWTLKFNMSEVFNQAFDIPLNRNLVIRQTRWRRVVENTSHYNNYSQFVLEEKRAVLHNQQLDVECDTNQCDNGHENQSDMWLLILWLTPILLVVVFVASLMMRESLRQKLVAVLLKPGDLKILYDNAAFNNQKNEVDYQYNKELELSKKDFKIEKNTVLGSGTFGIVYQGNVYRTSGEANIIVAVKTTQPSSPLTAITGMVSEIEVMSHLGRHENIVNLVGIHTKSISKGKIYLFLELCSLGSLDKYLRDKISMPNEEFTSVSVSADLYRWSCEISNAMDFLCLKRVVHADLATRNVLLTLDKRAKVSDFGLSRRLNEYDMYVKKQQEPLPWRWMAPESLRRREFNEKTDVWAFGVTLWEIYSLGDLPYGGISWTPDFSTQLVRGLRLEEPTLNERGMYSIMLKCWNMDPSKRPTFSQLKSSLH